MRRSNQTPAMFPRLPPLLLPLLLLHPFFAHCAVHPPLFNRISSSSSTTPAAPKPFNLTSDLEEDGQQNGGTEEQRQVNVAAANVSFPSVESKIRRLKELRHEMRTLATLIKEEKKRNRKGKAKFSHPSTADTMRSEISRQFRKWRKRVQAKIHSLIHRLDHLEGEMHRTKDNLERMLRGREAAREETKKRESAKWSKHPTALSNEAIRRVKIHERRRGESGSRCQEHGECKPGHCCQRASPMSELPLAVGEGAAHCHRYARGEGAACEHSCACEAQLLCFRELRRTSNSSAPVALCKRASSTDLLNGMYENALKSMFDHRKEAAAEQRRESRRERSGEPPI